MASSTSLFFLVLGFCAISAVVSSALENSDVVSEVKEESAILPLVSETDSHSHDAEEDEEKQGPDNFLYTYFEGQYCAFTNRNHNRQRCRNTNQCCYCGGLGGQICQSLCQKSDPSKFVSSSCDRCRCTCQYRR